VSVTRIHLDDEDAAARLAERIDALGFEVAVIAERFAGEDDDEAMEYVVCTPAARADLGGLVREDWFVTTD
jgi:alkanesulfonate monooxygenase SsuD/methylene tetrahydromethanopterin reductase-like flavin-dependent oxidoreductase (luciferase family)